MVSNSFLSTITEKHSIKESVISIFLTNEIESPDQYRSLITNGFSEKFQKGEGISQVKVEYRAHEDYLNKEAPSEIGFIFKGFKEGKEENGLEHALQGVNEKTRDRIFISYHSFDYKRWRNFINNYFDVLNILIQGRDEISKNKANAFSLHYVDQFVWESNEDLDLRRIFRPESGLLPKNLFERKLHQYVIVSETSDGYFERIEININYSDKPLITLSHNVTKSFQSAIEVNNLLNKTYFSDQLNQAHQYNKSTLDVLLSEEVKELINLNHNES